MAKEPSQVQAEAKREMIDGAIEWFVGAAEDLGIELGDQTVSIDDARYALIETDGVIVPWGVRRWFGAVPPAVSRNSDFFGFVPMSLDAAIEWRRVRAETGRIEAYNAKYLLPVFDDDVGTILAVTLPPAGASIVINPLLVARENVSTGWTSVCTSLGEGVKIMVAAAKGSQTSMRQMPPVVAQGA